MEETGFYYLHSEGDLIWKRFEPESDSPFVLKIWSCDPKDRKDAWTICIEALALAHPLKLEKTKERVRVLSEKWKLTFSDCLEMLRRINPSELMQLGIVIFAREIFGMNEGEFWDKVKSNWEGVNATHQN